MPSRARNPLRLLHITPHLGGGVGRVLSEVACYHTRHQTGIEEVYVCLETPEKSQFVDRMREAGSTFMLSPTRETVEAEIAIADIVQLEWWHHPLMAEWLHDFSPLTCRLVVWSHISGLHYPSFAKGWMELPHRFIATTPASGITQVVASSGGFADIPQRQMVTEEAVRFGYIGSLNAAKLHPEIMQYLEAAGPDLTLDVYGEMVEGSPLMPNALICLHGYTSAPVSALTSMDVLVYLLHPMHYGTTENALLEAMAAGVVPIVMDNPVEQSIVTHGVTGMVVRTPQEFADAVRLLTENHDMRIKMANAAAADVRTRFSLEATVQGLITHYEDVMKAAPRPMDFDAMFGSAPFDWFIAGLGRNADCFVAGAEDSKRKKRLQLPFLYEDSKSSVFHFLRYFPEDTSLLHWANVLREDKKFSNGHLSLSRERCEERI